MTTLPTPAPRVEQRLRDIVLVYERVKIVMLIVVLLVDIAIGVYLVQIARSNHQSLTLLRCAVSRTVQFDSHGKLRTPTASRDAFDKCVKASLR